MNTTLTPMQSCRVCHEEKPLSAFGVNRHIKSGINSMCKECGNKATAEWRVRTHVPKPPRISTKQSVEAFKAKQKEWRERNKESIAKRVREWQQANMEKGRAKTARYRERNPQAWAEHYAKNVSLYTERAERRRRAIRGAAPEWRNQFFILEAYRLARARSRATGIKWEVDHIVPLKSPIVCGLHVEHNLQVIPAVLNRSKGNKVIHHG